MRYELGWKHEKKSHKVCGHAQKIFFENLKNHHGNITYKKNCFFFEISSYTFKVATINFSCFKIPFICLMHSRKSCEHMDIFVSKVLSLIKCSPNCSNFFVNFNIST